MSFPDQFRKKTIKERQQQCRDVMTVHIRVGIDYDFSVAQPRVIKRFAHAGPDALNKTLDFLIGFELFTGSLLHVEDLASYRQYGLEPTIAGLLGRAACAITFDYEQFGVLE